MANYLVLVRAICFISMIQLGLGSGDGNGNKAIEADHNYLTHATETPQVIAIKPLEGEHKTEDWLQAAVDADKSNQRKGNYGSLKQLNIVKRAPSGFMGMRGKKDYESAENWSLDPLQVQANAAELDDGSIVDWIRAKKAPTGFYGVRGKKYASPSGNLNNLNDFLHKLEEDHIREAMLQDFIDRLALKHVSDNEIAKRAPTGFTGMRGKRPQMDFQEDEAGYVADDFNKRAPTNAFVGVRGKKDVSRQQFEQQQQLEAHQAFKRSPADSFAPRAKQQQRFIDFSNKFVAVRGKKSQGAGDAADDDDDNDAIADADNLNDAATNAMDDDILFGSSRQQLQQQQLDARNKMRFFVNALIPSLLNNANAGYKRTPGGFVGMRGKRPETR